MDFEYSPRTKEYVERLEDFMQAHILPANARFHELASQGIYPLEVLEPLKARAFEAGLWNLFMPELEEDDPGTRMTNLEYAPMAEVMGRVPWCSEVFNCSAPDTGNMEILKRFATPEQKARWLDPLMIGEIRSVVGLTEPDTASSDLTNLSTTILPDGDHYVINGRKWFSTGAKHPNAKLSIVFGVSDRSEDADPHRKHSFILVPMDTPGVEVVRDVPIMHHHAPEGHCEVVYRNVRVPRDAMLGQAGDGFMLAQARLGPGRIHHCMRTIGQCELALELMCERAMERKTFGKMLADNANIQDWIAQSRMEIDAARLLMLQTAWKMDRDGAKAARVDVSMIKVTAARLQTQVVDRAMQVFGAAGMTPDTPLSYLWTWGRAMRFLDGPDEVHMRVVARSELKNAKSRHGANAAHFVAPH
ncbi:acyl-CoA dehydrogenase [Lutimaribacter pacificus]|uniref:Acyl-CoA dehydrogenase n=1 Tax=Lutimaribacter pacificus TaxID=391948 RepID=A0A1H0EMR3_9RHOB|nr:acyl-CoA dehydrogenase family protein [Lutimaribacter pacificus]SDN83694.1 acyl-CoA dehydrogenase [Lutimaribacter pacificus]SHK51113.1 acyl-CoA dehydrogenase [Lutimaribacter pacificus]